MPRGVYERTPETCAAISKGMQESDAVKANGERMTGRTLSPVHIAAISKGLIGVPHTSPAQIAADKARRGVPMSPDACAAMSAAQIGVPRTSEAQIAADENMSGGNDICDHHMIYDHSDLSKNTMKMTRSMHQKLHQLFIKHGIDIPHINGGL